MKYIDFFSGVCSPVDVLATPNAPVPNDDPRRYPRPAVALTQGNLVLRSALVAAIINGGSSGGTGSCSRAPTATAKRCA